MQAVQTQQVRQTRRISQSSLERFTDQQLLDRSQAGDTDARHALVGRYRSVIRATAMRLSSNRQDAEDRDAEIYLHVFRVINSCNNIQTLSGWIKRVAINEIYQNWRRKKRQPQQVSLESIVESSGEGVLRGEESTNPATILLEQTETQDQSERLSRALVSLPAPQRLLCDLYYVQRRSLSRSPKRQGSHWAQ